MKTKNELKEIYIEIIAREVWPGDEKMIEYSRSACGEVVELDNGDIITIDKPRIQKDFCFGAGYNGMATEAEMNEAEDAADIARTSANYFISENLEPINRKIKELEAAAKGEKEAYTYLKYYDQQEDSKLKDFKIVNICNNPEYEPSRWPKSGQINKLSCEDIGKIIEGYKDLKKAFEKRLQAYLKRHGLKKLNVWTYISD